MAIISDLTMWKDCGFLEGDVRAPKIGATLPAGDYHLQESISPSKARLFSQLQLKVEWTVLREMSYLRAVYELGNESITIYGWIDAVTLLSDSEEAPMTAVDWHVDYWRTYNQQMVFRGGRIRRSGSSQFPQAIPMLRWEFSENVFSLPRRSDVQSYDGLPSRNYCWVVFSYVNDKSELSIGCFMAGLGGNIMLKGAQSDQGNLNMPNMTFVADGTWATAFGIASSKIKGAWVLNYDFVNTQGKGSDTDPIRLPEGFWEGNSNTYNNLKYGWLRERTHRFDEIVMNLEDNPVTTGDTVKFALTGVDGETIGELPWGKTVTKLRFRLIASANTCYTQVRTDINGHSEGTCFSIPATVLDMNENAWSDYNYSGQREYDVSAKSLQAREKLTGSLISTGLSGALMGQAFGGPVGAGIGAVGGLATAGIDYAMNEGVFNPASQHLKDELVAKQSDGLIIAGNGLDFIRNGQSITLKKMVGNQSSVARRSSLMSEFGYQVDIYEDNCQSVINAGGPLQISNLTIGGTAPIEAKRYAKALFERGVKLI